MKLLAVVAAALAAATLAPLAGASEGPLDHMDAAAGHACAEADACLGDVSKTSTAGGLLLSANGAALLGGGSALFVSGPVGTSAGVTRETGDHDALGVRAKDVRLTYREGSDSGASDGYFALNGGVASTAHTHAAVDPVTGSALVGGGATVGFASVAGGVYDRDAWLMACVFMCGGGSTATLPV